MYTDAKELFQHCDLFQRTRKPLRKDKMMLRPQVTLHAFDKWTIDFVGPINPLRKHTSTRYIITTTEYLTRWVEAKPVKNCDAVTTVQFIFKNIITRFGCPVILMSD